MYEFLLLLPVAALLVWYAVRAGSPHGFSKSTPPKTLPADYVKGLSYLGSEQPDKAIDSFIKVLEIDSDTIETHLALGNLYRRRGEVDRAIRIHQNLTSRPALTLEQRAEAMFELGQDYVSAGLLDRAEAWFRELIDKHLHVATALGQLVEIYEQEQEWESAIRAARRLAESTGGEWDPRLAHYYCQQAEREQRAGKLEQALVMVRQAYGLHRGSVRASLLEGDILAQSGENAAALSAYRRVEDQDPSFLPEAIPRVCGCLHRLGRTDEIRAFLREILDRYGGLTATLALVDHEQRVHGQASALQLLTEQLRRRPSVRGYQRLVELELLRTTGECHERLLILRRLILALLAQRPVYRCQQCGFPAKSLHWKCPGCRHWDTIKPVQGIEGE
ncbi:MAG: lipopolysaccharide assembly protein LapB [Gammaproteobacteria bacterium]|jgi:lipopolysaccharide biosynthesis regulator YciM